MWLQLDAATVVARLRDRGADRDVAKLADVVAFTSALDTAEPAVPHVAVDARGGIDDVVGRVLAALAR